MNALERFYQDLDKNDWDVRQESEINLALIKVRDELVENKLSDIINLSEIDRQVFQFSKSPEKKLSYKAAGVRKDEDGTEVPFEWPDIKTFSQSDFEYLYKRFKAVKNLYAKTEYGLVIFYSKFKQDNEFVIELLNSLVELIKIYENKASEVGDKNHYILYFRSSLANALYIANNRRSIAEIDKIYKSLIEYTFEVHHKWKVDHRSALRTVIDLTDFAIKYFKDFSSLIDLKKMIDKNWEAAYYLEKTYTWGAIYTTDINIKLSRLLVIGTDELEKFKAKQYEILADEALKKNNISAVSFIETAMNIYKGLKDDKNLNRLEASYQKYRSEFNLGEVSQELPEDESKRISDNIRRIVKEGDENMIVETLIHTPMLRPLSEIKQWSEESFNQFTLQNFLPTSIQDKFGNTIAKYSTEEERKQFSVFRTYEMHFQIAAQTILQFIIEAIKAGKLNDTILLSALRETWLNKDAKRRLNGRETSINYLSLVTPGIKLFFDELSKWSKDASYRPNFVCATDSLVLKAEYLLREFCMIVGVPTFKPKPKEVGVIMEKTLDDLLRDLDGKLSEDDLFLIKFLLTDKAGLNLRNRIAHGLLDNTDYGVDYPIYALLIILKLSNYQFKPVAES